MRLWSFKLTITRRDEVLTEIDEVLSRFGVKRTGVEGVRELAEYFRRADAAAQGARRRVSELEASILEYERALRGVQAVERQALARREEEATPIERMARNASGVDLPLTQRTPVYVPPDDDRARPMPILAEPGPRINRPGDADTLGTIDLTELGTDKRT
jgi:hypothetical protein